MIVVLDDDLVTLGQLRAALDAHVRQLRRNGRYPTPDLLAFLRSIEAKCGQVRPEVARPAPAADAGASPVDRTGPRSEAIGMTYREAGELLGLSERTVRRRVRAGELPVIRIGGSCRIPKTAVTALAAQTDAR